MKTIIKCAGFAILILMAACRSEAGHDYADITRLEKQSAANRTDIKVARQLDAAYQKYMIKYPGDTNQPHILFEDAQLNIYPLNKTDKALDLLEQLYTKYPQSRYAPNGLFKAAFLNETAKQNFPKAKELYAMFIKNYPANPLANDARISLENIGLSPEEQFKKIQAVQDSVKNQKKVHP